VAFIVIKKGAFMLFYLKLALSITVIIVCTQIGKRFPTLGGLIATMPLTGLIVLIWLYSDNPTNFSLLEVYTKGALWGIGPTILFFVSAYLCLHMHLSLTVVLSISFSVWFVGACIHQLLIR